MKKKRLFIGAAVFLVLVIGFFVVRGTRVSDTAEIVITVVRGPFS